MHVVFTDWIFNEKGLETNRHMGKLSGITAIVTGGSREIGSGIFKALAKEGAIVAVNYQSNRAEEGYTVHRALPNQLGNQVRLSCDFRYQPVDMPVDPSSLQPHEGTEYFTWNELYEGWRDSWLQYYWKSYNLDFSEWDESIRWQKEKIC
jgi:hypothetical protein